MSSVDSCPQAEVFGSRFLGVFCISLRKCTGKDKVTRGGRVVTKRYGVKILNAEAYPKDMETL